MKKILLLLLMFSATSFAQNKEEKTNFLFIAIDDMNDWTGFLGGHPQAITPNLDRLAEKGTNFSNAHCSAPGCSPSRNALLYGVEPFNSGLYPFYDEGIHEQLMKEYVSLPRLLKENGYITYGAGKIHHGSKNDEREWTNYLETKKHKKIFAEGEGYQLGKKSKMSFRPTIQPEEDNTDYEVASYGVDFLKDKHNEPFFLAIGIVKPHLPFDAPKRFFDALPDEITPPEILENDLNDIPAVGKSLRKAGEDKRFRAANKWSDVRKAYLACISWADYNIGRVLDALEKSEYADNTVVIIWSDHGYHMGEKMAFKKFTLWERATRVPFIIYDPKGKNNGTIEEAVSLINIYKTIADKAKIETPKYVDGTSLLPLVMEKNTILNQPAITSWGQGNYAVRDNQYRYIRYFDGTEELYMLTEDKNEWKNLAKDENFKPEINRLSKYLPKTEKTMIKEYVNPWSVEGEFRKVYRNNKVK